jgi:hypothetical protein
MLEKTEVGLCVLDVLRHDAMEDLQGILGLLNSEGCFGWREFWPHDFTEIEVLEALKELDAAGLVLTLLERPDQGGFLELPRRSQELKDNAPGLWFRLTTAGRREWEKWDPPVHAEDAVVHATKAAEL